MEEALELGGSRCTPYLLDDAEALELDLPNRQDALRIRDRSRSGETRLILNEIAAFRRSRPRSCGQAPPPHRLRATWLRRFNFAAPRTRRRWRNILSHHALAAAREAAGARI